MPFHNGKCDEHGTANGTFCKYCDAEELAAMVKQADPPWRGRAKMKTTIYGVASQGIWVGESYLTEAEAVAAWQQLTKEGYAGLTVQSMEVELPFNAHDAQGKQE